MNEQLSARMRETWDTLARANAMHYIASERKEWDRDEFLRSGRDKIRALLDSVGQPRGGVALDLGCGIGRLSLALAGEFDVVHGVDVSREMVWRANHLKSDLGCANVHFHCNNGLDLAFMPTASCDFAFSWIVLQHVPDPEIVLGYVREMARVVRPGGHVLFQMPVYRYTPMVTPWRVFQHGFRKVLSRFEASGLIAADKGLAFRGSRLTMSALRSTLTETGLEATSMRPGPSTYRFCDDLLVYAARQ